MATRSKVKILGSTYYITTQGSEEKVRKIEEEMNAQLGELMEQRPSLSALDALVVLSLNLMDHLTEGEASTDRMREQLSQYLEDAAKARMELEDQKRLADRCRKELEAERARTGRLSRELEEAKAQPYQEAEDRRRQAERLTRELEEQKRQTARLRQDLEELRRRAGQERR